MKNKLLFLSSFFLLAMTSSAAVFTEDSMIVNSVTRNLLFSIPDNYNPDSTYSLVIGLHYCGGNAAEYRIALQQLTDSLGMIVACPDYLSLQVPNKDTNMFGILVDTACAKYNIDRDEVFLTGMSCNGEYILRQGLKGIFPFKGIFPWAPYVTLAWPTIYNFDSDMPTVISIGTNDDRLIPVLMVYDSLKRHQGNINLILDPGVFHTINYKTFSGVMFRSLDYLNNGSDIKIQALDDIEMNGDEIKEIKFKVDNPLDKDITLNYYSSQPVSLPVSEINSTDSVNQYSFELTPKNTKGNVYIVIELIENKTHAITQSTFRVKINKVVAVKSNKVENRIKLYPNPVMDVLHIDNLKSDQNVEVYDMMGKLLFKVNSVNDDEICLPFNLPTGLYVVKISDLETFESYIVSK